MATSTTSTTPVANRSCPQCHAAATAAWLAAREAELLPVPYFHVVFTLPAALREVVRAHPRVCLAALMTTAAESLRALAADPHYVGGTLGILAVLHTWTRALVYHPHVHCLVPAGALGADGATWHPARDNFLVPVRAPSVRFRTRFLARLRRRLPTVVLPAGLWARPWVVYCKPTVQGSGSVLRYRARYVHRAAITDARMRAVTRDHVSFSYKDAQAHTSRRMTLPGDEFLRPFLQHVLPSGFHKVRYYGLWAPAAQATGGASSRAWAPRTSSRRHLTRHRTSGRRDPNPPPVSAVCEWRPAARPSPRAVSRPEHHPAMTRGRLPAPPSHRHDMPAPVVVPASMSLPEAWCPRRVSTEPADSRHASPCPLGVSRLPGRDRAAIIHQAGGGRAGKTP